MTARLRCPYCGLDIWTSDDGAACTDPQYATGFTTASLSCGAEWDSIGHIITPPQEDMIMRKFGLSTPTDEDPAARGEVNGRRVDALEAARVMAERSGAHHLVQPDGCVVRTTDGQQRR